MNIIEYGSQFIGHHETDGKNAGPLIDKWKKLLGPGVASAKGISWCAVYVSAMLMERNGLDRKGLIKAISFPPGVVYLEACDAWLWAAQTGKVPGLKIVTDPRPGDIFLMMAKDKSGKYSTKDAHHIGFVSAKVDHMTIATLEGNTVPGFVEGATSRNGGGTWARSRSLTTGRMVFLRLSSNLTGL